MGTAATRKEQTRRRTACTHRSSLPGHDGIIPGSDEEKYKALIETTGTGYVCLDSSGRIIDANREYVRLSGHTRLSQILGSRATEWTAPHDRARNAAEIRKCLMLGAVRNLEIDYVDRKGRITPIEVNATVWRGSEGPVVVTLCRDITERKRVEAAVRQNEEKFTKAFHHSPNLMAISSIAEGRVMDVNEGLLKSLGYRRDEVIGKTTKELRIYPNYRERQFIVRALRQDGFIRDRDVSIRTRAGDILCGIYSGEIIEVNGQRVLLSMLADVTARKQMEMELRQSEARYRCLFEQAADPIVIFDPETLEIVDFNGEACRSLGYTPKEFAKLRVSAIEAIESPEELRRHASGISLERVEVFETRQRTKSGVVHDVAVRTRAFRFGGRTVLQAMWHDITEQKSAGELLERRVAERTAQLKALTEQMAEVEGRERRRIADILHEDLQQLLGAAKYLVAGIAKTDKKKTEELSARASEVLQTAIDRVRSLTTTLRPPVLYEFGLGAALEWLAEEMEGRHGLTVEVKINKGAEPATDDMRDFMFHAVRELLFNVVKHAGVKSAQVRMAPAGADRIRVQVKDAGVGINLSTQSANGFGIATIRERASFFKGQLQIVEKPGQGTCVTLTLPRG